VGGKLTCQSHGLVPVQRNKSREGQNSIKILKSVTAKGLNHYCAKDLTEMFIELCAPVNELVTFKSVCY
jgi:hypothetical protein